MTYDLKLERLIDGTPEEVFDAFIDGEAIKEWYRIQPDWQTEVLAAEGRVGGTMTVTFGAEEKYREEATYIELDRPRRIVYEEKMGRVADGASFTTTVTVTLERQDGKTLLTLVQEGFHVKERRDAHEQGWPQFLSRLDEVVAKRRAA